MKGKITLAIIKPDAVKNEKIGAILNKYNEAGFHIVAMKHIQLTKPMAAAFYSVHKERPFYNDLINFMTSGPVVPVMLEKDNAVEDYRKLIGSTNPAEADEGTIRKLFATSIEKNAVHGSDSDENAIIETNFFFAESERFYKG